MAAVASVGVRKGLRTERCMLAKMHVVCSGIAVPDVVVLSGAETLDSVLAKLWDFVPRFRHGRLFCG